MHEIWVAAVANAEKNRRIINMSSSQKGVVDWRANDLSFSGQSKGLMMEKAGQTWLGDGYLAGKQYQVGLEDSTSKTGEESSGGERGIRGSAGTNASGSASPK